VTIARAAGRLISRSEIVERACSWLRDSVPYSQTRFHQNEYGIYRADCSGFVSMAWGMPGKPEDRHGGSDTPGLVVVSSLIAAEELKAGDVIIRGEGTSETRHVVIFAAWAEEPGRYWAYEQAGGHRTRLRSVTYPYETDAESYAPRRYVSVLEP
jgi:cell wall-associated NlpC family hydrolase